MEEGAWFELIESRLSSSVSVIIEFRGLSKGPKLFESLCNKTRVICKGTQVVFIDPKNGAGVALVEKLDDSQHR